MKTYFNNPSKVPATIMTDIVSEHAEALVMGNAKSDILIGDNGVFIHPSEYGVDGYFFTEEDLRYILNLLRRRKSRVSKVNEKE